MGSGSPFTNNWAYLDTELTWLERLLLVAVSQQRQNLKSVNRVAKTSADKATSDWWQGIIAVKNRAYDETPSKLASPGPGYQKTLDQRILLSQASQVSLGLPTMQMALGLSLFEKKLVLMALAPEVQIRYGRLYHYLQSGSHGIAGALPTVDLALRILCRNPQERRRARNRLAGPNSLLDRQVLHCVENEVPTLLASHLKLAPEWVDYLLAETPDPIWPTRFLLPERFTQVCRDQLPWSQVVVADAPKQQLQASPSRLLLVGQRGTGKQTIAIATATQLKRPLHMLDLAQVSPQDWPACLAELDQATYAIVLIKSAHHWLGRGSAIDRAALQHWFTHSQARIIFSVSHRHLVLSHWRQQLAVLAIPMPDATQRLTLWNQTFNGGVKGMGKARWSALAEGLALSGGQMMTIAQTTQAIAGQDAITLDHLQQGLTQQGYAWQLR